PAAPRVRPSPPSIPGYDVLKEISRGGQGVVLQAHQRSTRRSVAIKVLREGHFADRHEVGRFEREVRVLGQLKHPNIVAIHESGSAEGRAYYVMDYISGKTLDEYVESLREKSTPRAPKSRAATSAARDGHAPA